MSNKCIMRKSIQYSFITALGKRGYGYQWHNAGGFKSYFNQGPLKLKSCERLIPKAFAIFRDLLKKYF